jgi:hypothetical protein
MCCCLEGRCLAPSHRTCHAPRAPHASCRPPLAPYAPVGASRCAPHAASTRLHWTAVSRSDIVYVAMTIYVCCKCKFQVFICFKRMLQVFYLDIAYVAVAIQVCCKCMFQIFNLFQTYVASVSSGYCIYCNVAYISDICWKRLFKIFYLFQTYVANVFI